MYKREVEIQRTNIDPRQFYDYCKKRAEKKGINIEGYAEYDWWTDGCYKDEYHATNHDWGKEAYKKMPFEVVMYLKNIEQNFMWQFILEWDDGTGYCYIKEEALRTC